MARIRSLSWISVFTLTCFFGMAIAPPADARPPRRKRKAPPTSGKLQIFSVAKGANVEVDGRPLGTLPLKAPLVLEPGSHTIRVWKRGHLEFLETVEVFAGETAELDADLIAVAGMVKVYANVPGAQVVIDGKLAGSIPFDKDVPAGKHTLVVQAQGHTPFSQDVEIVAGKWLELQVQLRPASPTATGQDDDDSVVNKWWFWTIIGAVVVGGAATGLALGLQGDTEVPATPSSVLNLR